MFTVYSYSRALYNIRKCRKRSRGDPVGAIVPGARGGYAAPASGVVSVASTQNKKKALFKIFQKYKKKFTKTP
jgi:hypothetical protein